MRDVGSGKKTTPKENIVFRNSTLSSTPAQDELSFIFNCHQLIPGVGRAILGLIFVGALTKNKIIATYHFPWGPVHILILRFDFCFNREYFVMTSLNTHVGSLTLGRVTVHIAHCTKSQKSCDVQHIARQCKYRNSIVCKGSAGELWKIIFTDQGSRLQKLVDWYTIVFIYVWLSWLCSSMLDDSDEDHLVTV